MTTPEKYNLMLKVANSLRKVGLTEYQVHRAIQEIHSDGVEFVEKARSATVQTALREAVKFMEYSTGSVDMFVDELIASMETHGIEFKQKEEA